jgi:hypothetical protein
MELPFLAMAAELTVARDGDVVSLSVGGQPLVEYRGAPNPQKTYVAKLFSPGGLQVLLDSPPDHVHHHGLMLGLDVERTSFWVDGREAGTQLPQGPTGFTPGQNGEARGALEQALAWNTPDGQTLLEERRRIAVLPSVGPGTPTVLTWTSRLSVGSGRAAVRMYTNRHYVGLGLRFVRSLDRVATFQLPSGNEGTVVTGTERVTPDRWCACTGPVDGEPVTVAMFSHPANPRYPTHWFTMTEPFAYLAATLNLYRQPILLREGKPLEMTCAVAVWDGARDGAAIEEAYRRWVAATPPPQVWDEWAATHANVARPELGSTATASSSYGPEYEPAKAFDGKWAVRETDKWNSAADITPHFLRLDLGQVRSVDRIRLYHEGLLPDGDPFTTADFRLQASLQPWGPWADLTPPVRRNREGVTEHAFQPTPARFLRLLIETGEQNGGNAYGRIFEMEVLSPKDTLKGTGPQ